MIVRFLTHSYELTLRLWPVYVALCGLILAGAFLISKVEGLPLGTAVYFSFITGLTVGYGDIVPHTSVGRFIAVLLGFVGILFTGIVVAVAVKSVREAWEEEDRAR